MDYICGWIFLICLTSEFSKFTEKNYFLLKCMCLIHEIYWSLSFSTYWCISLSNFICFLFWFVYIHLNKLNKFRYLVTFSQSPPRLPKITLTFILNIGYCLDLESPPKTHVWKAWFLAWCFWEVVNIKRRPVGRL